MVEVSVGDGMLKVKVLGWHKILACKRRFRIPLDHVRGAQRKLEDVLAWWKGWRLCGTSIPGIIVAGWYYKDGQHVFWDVRRPQNTITIDLVNESYSRLIVEVADPDATISLIRGVTGNFPAR
jgi:hypothetical protein